MSDEHPAGTSGQPSARPDTGTGDNPTTLEGQDRTAGAPAATRRAGMSDALGGRRVVVDTAGPPIAFVVGMRLLDLQAAAVLAGALAICLVGLRLARGHQLRYAIGGFAGVGVGVGAALWSGEGTAYFAPAMLINAFYAVVAVVSILVRRPLIAWLAVALMRVPPAWCWHPRVRPAYSEITWAWAGLFALRAGLRYALITAGHLELLATVHIVLGFPAFAALIALTYWYVPRRLRQLGAPEPRAGYSPRAVT